MEGSVESLNDAVNPAEYLFQAVLLNFPLPAAPEQVSRCLGKGPSFLLLKGLDWRLHRALQSWEGPWGLTFISKGLVPGRVKGRYSGEIGLLHNFCNSE